MRLTRNARLESSNWGHKSGRRRADYKPDAQILSGTLFLIRAAPLPSGAGPSVVTRNAKTHLLALDISRFRKGLLFAKLS